MNKKEIFIIKDKALIDAVNVIKYSLNYNKSILIITYKYSVKFYYQIFRNKINNEQTVKILLFNKNIINQLSYSENTIIFANYHQIVQLADFNVLNHHDCIMLDFNIPEIFPFYCEYLFNFIYNKIILNAKDKLQCFYSSNHNQYFNENEISGLDHLTKIKEYTYQNDIISLQKLSENAENLSNDSIPVEKDVIDTVKFIDSKILESLIIRKNRMIVVYSYESDLHAITNFAAGNNIDSISLETARSRDLNKFLKGEFNIAFIPEYMIFYVPILWNIDIIFLNFPVMFYSITDPLKYCIFDHININISICLQDGDLKRIKKDRKYSVIKPFYWNKMIYQILLGNNDLFKLSLCMGMPLNIISQMLHLLIILKLVRPSDNKYFSSENCLEHPLFETIYKYQETIWKANYNAARKILPFDFETNDNEGFSKFYRQLDRIQLPSSANHKGGIALSYFHNPDMKNMIKDVRHHNKTLPSSLKQKCRDILSKQDFCRNFDFVTFVPSQNEKSYITDLCKEIAEWFNARFVNLLQEKFSINDSQRNSNCLAQKIIGRKCSFEYTGCVEKDLDRHAFDNASCLIVDDIYETGSSFNVCADLLLRNMGISKIMIFALAKK